MVERPTVLSGSAANEGPANARIATVVKRILHGVYLLSVLDGEQIESADLGSLGVAPNSLIVLKVSNLDHQLDRP
jgi:hypothetical protein